MKRCLRLSAYLCLAAFMAVGSAAHADSFAFNATGDFFSASGTLTVVADPSLANVFEVTAISGTVNGEAITGLLPCAAYDPSHPCVSSGNSFLYDDLLYPDGIPTGIHQVLDDSGIGFSLSGGTEADFAAIYTHFYDVTYNVPRGNSQIVGFSISPIPEPGSFILLGTGLLGIAGSVRRRMRG